MQGPGGQFQAVPARGCMPGFSEVIPCLQHVLPMNYAGFYQVSVRVLTRCHPGFLIKMSGKTEQLPREASLSTPII